MHVINLAGASSVKNPRTDEVHEADADGVFRTIPLDYAHELVTRHASHWRELSAHEAAKSAAALEELRNPHVIPKAVAELRGRADGFESRIAALEAHIGREVLGLSEADDGADDAPVAEKAAPARKTTAAKTTASKRTAGARKGAAAKPKAGDPAEEPSTEDEPVEDQAE